VLAAFDADPKHAAAVLGRLLKLDPRALALVNRWRRDRQMHALRSEGCLMLHTLRTSMTLPLPWGMCCILR